MYYRRLPIAKIRIIVIAVFFTITAATLGITHHSKPISEKALAKNYIPSKITPTKNPTPTPKKKIAKVKLTSTPTPTITKALGGIASVTPSPTSLTTPTPLITFVPPTITPTNPPPSGGSLLDQVNAYRASQGLGAVQTSSETCAFAATRAQEIASNFSHDAFNSRISSNTLPYARWTAATENIAQTSNAQNVVQMWINSPGHAANMRADTPYVCIMQNGDYYAYEGMKP